jgi:oligoendopeptidase F
MAKEPRKRADVPEADRWAVESVFASDDAWEKEFSTTEGFDARAAAWSGRLGESPEILLRAVEEMMVQRRTLEKLYTYASMKQDGDLSDSTYTGMYSRIASRNNSVMTSQSFLSPELLAIPVRTMDSWLAVPELAPYRVLLEDILRYRPFTLSGNEEKLLTMSRDVTSGFSSAFGKLGNVDIPGRLPEIDDDEGGRIRITNGNFISLLHRRDRRVRKDAFSGFYTELKGNVPTLASLLESQVKSDIYYAKARNYPSALESSLFHDEVGREVYLSLIESVHRNLPVLHKYFQLKKRLLGVDPMHFYDVYVPTVPESRGSYTWDEAVELTLEAVTPLGPEYRALLEQGFRDRWADRYENTGKRSGAYSGGCYDTFPFILHNFSGTLDSVFTLAHEAGHSMHSLLSRMARPFHMADYRILVAEVASTTNEMLLVDLLSRRLTDPMEKAYLLDHLIGMFKGTLFRQCMFAEFEMLTHEHVETGGSLTSDWLNQTYFGLVRDYHGDAFDFDGEDAPIAWEWARIPHFYYNFYVYKYSTGLASSVDISARILRGEPGAVQSYLEFLRGGSSRPPLELLRGAGVDLTTPRPVDSALAFMAGVMKELSGLLSGDSAL